MDSVVLAQASPGAGSEGLGDREKVATRENGETEAALRVPKLGRHSASQQTGQGQDPLCASGSSVWQGRRARGVNTS